VSSRDAPNRQPVVRRSPFVDVVIAAATTTAVMIVVTGWSGSKTSCSKGSRLLSFLTEKRLRCVSLRRPTAQYTHTHSLVFIHSQHTLPQCIALCYTQESRKLVCILCCVSESSVRTTRPNWRIPFCPDVPATSTTMEVDHWLTIIC